METIRHNKKQNTGLLFELLSQQVVSNAVSKNDIKVKKALYLIKKYFRPGTQLYEELQLINAAIYNQVEKWNTASKLLYEIIDASKKIDQKKLKDEKYSLLSEIYANFDKTKFFEGYVPNYPVYASLYSLMESSKNPKVIFDVKSKVRLEENIINHLLDNTEIKRINEFAQSKKNAWKKDLNGQPLDDLTMYFIVKKFNQKYDKVLTESQKEILREYINCTSERKFDQYASKKSKKIENELYEGMKKVHDKSLMKKMFEAMQKLGNIGSFSKDKKTEMLMNYAQLIEELKHLEKENGK